MKGTTTKKKRHTSVIQVSDLYETPCIDQSTSVHAPISVMPKEGRGGVEITLNQLFSKEFMHQLLCLFWCSISLVRNKWSVVTKTI